MKLILYLCTLFVSVLLLAGCAHNPSTKSDLRLAAPATSFRAFLDETYAEDMRLYPATAAYRGIRDRDRDGKWNSISEEFRERMRKRNLRLLEQAFQYDPSGLSAAEQLSQQLFILNLKRMLARDDFRRQRYVIHQFWGPHSQLPSFLINIHRVKNLQHAESYIERLQNAGTWFDEIIEQMQLAASAGVFLPPWSYPQLIQTSRNVVTGAPFSAGAEDSTLLADYRSKVASLDLSESQSEELIARAEDALLRVVAPAYERLIAEIERQMAGVPDGDGVWKLPDGSAFYSERLRYYTTTDLNADEVHAIGLQEVKRVHSEMRGIMSEVKFEGKLSAFMRFMRTDPRFYYPSDDEGRARYLAEATAVVEAMRERLPEIFGLLPNADLEVKRVEPFRERSAGKAFYNSPAADGSRPGIYYANLHNMNAMPVYQMEALAYHEGIPGHHMQRSIAVELEGVPEFQKYSRYTAYTEGWGLYAEFLPREMGFYTDPYSNFGRLAMELWRAARLVVDTGLHHKRWSREQAIEYLVENTPNSRYDATRAIERYAVMPGQATAYMIGKLKIVELRERARVALGDKFDLRDFHDEILKDGPVPLSILEDKIDRWVQRSEL